MLVSLGSRGLTRQNTRMFPLRLRICCYWIFLICSFISKFDFMAASEFLNPSICSLSFLFSSSNFANPSAYSLISCNLVANSIGVNSSSWLRIPGDGELLTPSTSITFLSDFHTLKFLSYLPTFYSVSRSVLWPRDSVMLINLLTKGLYSTLSIEEPIDCLSSDSLWPNKDYGTLPLPLWMHYFVGL